MYCQRCWYVIAFVWVFFFFSSRRRHTRFDCDWSSDVCSSDLGDVREQRSGAARDVVFAGGVVVERVGANREVVPAGGVRGERAEVQRHVVFATGDRKSVV